MRLIFSIAILSLLAGCATEPQIKTVFQVKEVQVAVREKCAVKIPPDPAWAVAEVPADAEPLAHSQAVLADLEIARAYIKTLKAEAKRCE